MVKKLNAIQMKFDISKVSDSEINALKNFLGSIYKNVKGSFKNFSDFQNVILSSNEYHSNHLINGQKPEEMIKQFLVEPLIKYLGFTQQIREGSLPSPFGNKYPDYVISGANKDDITLYVEAEPINTNLYAANKGIGQVSQWLISKAARSEYGIATDGISWILVKFDASSNKTKEVLKIDLRPYFTQLINPASKYPNDDINVELEKLLNLRPAFLRKLVNNYVFRSENQREKITKKFYEEYVRYVFGVDENGNPTGGICLKDSINIPRSVVNPQRELFAVITMNRILFIEFLEDMGMVPTNLLTDLLETYKRLQLPRSFYSTYLNPLFYDVLNKSIESRKSNVTNISEFEKIPYLNGGLFRKNLPFEELYDIDDEGIELVISNLLKYKIGLSGKAEIQPEILGYIFEKTINYISETGKSNKQKMEGAYYTPEDVVSFIIDKTLNNKIFEKMISGLRDAGWTDTDVKGYTSIEDILANMPKNPKHSYQMLRSIDEIRVLDPACGSGHFLTAAANVLARVRASILLAIGQPLNMYDIKRTVISKNIFGVDIDEIGVEITKLRLWLSIVAEATKVEIGSKEHIETLPNIDFNIIAGNSLVGQLHENLYLSLSGMETDFFNNDDFKKILNEFNESDKNELERLLRSNRVEDLSKAYMRLRSTYQRASGGNALIMRDIIMKIRESLYSTVNSTFLSYLLSFNIGNKNNKKLSPNAINCRMPIHWTIDYNNILENGGFDVIIGNPPYIEDKDYNKSDLYIIKKNKVIGDRTSPLIYNSSDCGNTYAYFIERSMKLLNKSGRFGFIVPISLVSTERMASVRSIIHTDSGEVVYYNFDDRPGKIFSGIQDCRSTIVITQKGKGVDEVVTSKYHRWHSKDRPKLFEDLKTTRYKLSSKEEIIPKISTEIELMILDRMKAQSNDKVICNFLEKDRTKVWYYDAPRYWIHAHLEGYIPKRGAGSDISSHYKFVEFREEYAPIVTALLSSTLFYWFFVTYSDGRDLLHQHVSSFPIDLASIDTETKKKLTDLVLKLMNDYNKNSKSRKNKRKGGNHNGITEIKTKYSYKIIEKIDTEISKIFLLNKEELEFIKNFDLNFRLG